MKDTTTTIINAEIAEAIVRTAYSRVQDCLLILKDQQEAAIKEVKISKPAQSRMANMLIQDFSSAHNPLNGAMPLRNPCLRDLEFASHFKTLAPQLQKAIAASAFTQLVGNFNASPLAQGMKFTL